ncbi:MAG: DUF3394 domain-containing protein, partial [Rhodospirillaceae bacterium]|nr:DUF3394 domain-containing protein [Rhodospirillaceae bacterium]
LADDTPPVGLAAFAAAAISGGDPIRTGVQGFMYDIRTALLPFLFIFNTELLLIDVSAGKAVIVFVIAVVAMMLFAAATQGYFFARNRIWETAILLLVAFSLFRPGYWLDQVEPEFAERPGAEIVQDAEKAPEGGTLRVTVSGPNFNDPDRIDETTVTIPFGKPGNGLARLRAAGLLVVVEEGKAKMEEPLPTSPLKALARSFDFYGDTPTVIKTILVPNERMAKELFYIPAVFLLILVILLQRRRQTQPAF